MSYTLRIVDLILPDMIVPVLAASSKEEVMAELARHIAKQRPALSAVAVERALLEREALGSTALGDGVAIPHAKLPGLTEIVACLGRAAGGVAFDAQDGSPSHLFFVLLAPQSSSGTHLKALARISRVFRDGAFRQRLLSAGDANSMYNIVAEEDAKV